MYIIIDRNSAGTIDTAEFLDRPRIIIPSSRTWSRLTDKANTLRLACRALTNPVIANYTW